MKRIILTGLLVIAVCMTSFGRKLVAEGKTSSAIGNYKIEIPDSPVMINGVEMKSFVISYANSNMEVFVAIKTDKKQKTYYVLSNVLDVQYICNGQWFGVTFLDKELEKDDHRTSPTALNKVEYFRQKAITTGESCELDHTKLIAVFFPMLINNFENILATK
jgi:hypothetical protein